VDDAEVTSVFPLARLLSHSESHTCNRRLTIPSARHGPYAIDDGGPMLMTSGIAPIIIAVKFLIGALIGAATAGLIYRSRLTSSRIIRATFLAGIAYLVASGLAGWADSHAAFENGHRMDVAPWGENLRLRNFVAENEIAICLAFSIVAALLGNARSKNPPQSN